MPITDTPLRYPGGKTQMAPLVLDVLRLNGLQQGFYCEPFAGGAGIACRLLVEGHISEAWINDIDPAIHAFWHSVLRASEELCDLIERSPVTIEEWHTQRAVQERRTDDLLRLGFSTLFLNRTNRSGILRGGVIGGLQQNGAYALNCRFNRPDLIRKVKRLALYADRIKLTRMDAREYITKVVPTLPRRSLVNVDPPYFAQGPELYTSFYSAHDHADLANTVRAIDRPWMLTYDDAPEIAALYAGLPGTRTSLTYYAQVKRRGTELLVAAPTLKFPAEVALTTLPSAVASQDSIARSAAPNLPAAATRRTRTRASAETADSI